MKKIVPLLLGLSIVACSKGNHTKAKKLDSRSPLVEKEFKKVMDQNRLKKCEFAPETSTDSVDRNKFDLKFSKDLSKNIVAELKKYTIEQRAFRAEDFWLALSPESYTQLNEYLVEEYSMLEDEDYAKIRDLAASSYLFYFQEEIKRDAYEIQVNRPELKVTTLKIAFTEAANLDHLHQVNLCDDFAGRIKFNEARSEDKKNLRPSDITTDMVCEKKRRGQSLDMKVINDNILKLKYTENDKTQEYSVSLFDIDMDVKRKKGEFSFLQDNALVEIKVKKRRDKSTGELTTALINFKSIDAQGVKIKANRLKCQVLKDIEFVEAGE